MSSFRINADKVASFKAYDIRGRVPDELNEELAHQIALAFAAELKPRRVVVGRDMRLSSEAICAALSDGFLQAGVDVIDIGLGGTENVYFATAHLEKEGVDGGVMVTASHNPADYNGMKLVTRGSAPISGDSGLHEIENRILRGDFAKSDARGQREELDLWSAYCDHLLTYVDVDSLKALRLVSNPGNGCAGLAIDHLEPRLPFSFHKVHHEPDGTFPHGVPNPLLPENRAPTTEAVQAIGADLGLAWDGDFDRCFFFDEKGRFVDGYYIVGLFAAEMLAQKPGSAIIHDPRLTWNTLEMVQQAGGRAVQCKTGHAFIKERMRKEDAVYGGEMSAHHYFRDFAYCDSGMIPWLLMAQMLSRGDRSLSSWVDERARLFPSSGEINRRLENADAALQQVEERYVSEAVAVDRTDGLGVEYADWRFSLRKSQTEPLLRLNVESRGNVDLMQSKTEELLSIIDAAGNRNDA